MLPVSLDVALLKLALPELVLRPGMSVVARVASRGDGNVASLVLAGALLKATVPDEVRAGDVLRLSVAETSAERVVFKLESNQPPPPMALDQPVVAQPPPQGDPRGADADGSGEGRQGDPDRPAVALAYETPALGRLDLRIERGPEGVVVSVTAPAGAYALAHARATPLREALEARLGVPASVRVLPRREPFDAYA
ncbi:MAG: Membrane fusion component of MSF-type tripartite multidrug efflux system [uncultured Solirubrobacteraceae bacterium]|uniref:Membrane fusion component of MSF-type tripartite multidrug efflux system n=1 Tax=uncultured Solirubrobacteraceae bacterium TaxID=1162706 RepID=A0A6J4RM47_9ACTN|nr:MAG: Membrane fusion component of MSF-type tripartite multidrug efflux system [uncultured Solirubrobacteraceae bacterium]